MAGALLSREYFGLWDFSITFSKNKQLQYAQKEAKEPA
jgi:hypothetical protein